MAAELAEIVEFLDRELETARISDYPGAVNGLQLENSGQVPRVIAAVDASLAVIEKAAESGPGLLLVHHGLFWQGARPIVGGCYRKLKAAIDAGLAVYSSHLPLDIHPEWGNNVLLARAIGLRNCEPFLPAKDRNMGVRGTWGGTREELRAAIMAAVGEEVHVCAGGSGRVISIGLVTGGAGSQVAEVAAVGCDAFITGEGPHWSFPLAEELGIDVFYAGHYATETFGVRALADIIASKWNLPMEFLDFPTGL